MPRILLFSAVLCMSMHAQSQEVDVAQCEAASPSVSLPFNITCQDMYDIADETHPTMVQACNAAYIDRFMTNTQREDRVKHCGFLVTYLYPFYRAEQIALQRGIYTRPADSSVIIFDDETTPHIRAMTATVRLLTTAPNIKTCNIPATGLASVARNAVLRCYNSTSLEETIGHPHRFVLPLNFPTNITYREIPYVLPTGNNEGFVAITESVNNLGTDQTDTEVFLLAGGLYANVARPGADCNADGSCNFSANSGRVNWCGEANKNWCVLAATGHQYPIGRYLNGVWRFGNNVFTGDNGTSYSTMIIATTMAFLKRAYEHTDLSYKDIVSIVRSCASDLGDVGPDAENGLGALSYECLHQGFETPFAPHPKEVIRTEYAHSEFTASTPVSFPQYTSTTILTRSVQSSTSTDVERTEINRVSDAVLGETSAIETTTITYLISTRTDVTVTETTVSETIDFLGEEEIDRSSQVVGMTVTPLSHLSTGTQTQVLVSAVPYTVLEETTVEIDASTEIDVQRERTGRSTRVELGGLSATETVTVLFLVSTRTDVFSTRTSILEISTSLRTQLLAISTEVVSVDVSRASLLSTGTETQTLTNIIPYRVLQETSVQVEVGTTTHTQRVETGRNTDTEFGTLSATQTTTISFLISTRTDVLTTRTSVLETSTHLRTQLLATGTEIVSVDTSRVTFLSTATETQITVSVMPYTMLEETPEEVDVAQCEAASPSVSLPFDITCQEMYNIADETHPTMVQACNAAYIDRFMTNTQREERRKHCGFLVTYLYPFYRAEQIALQRETDPYTRPENSSVIIFDDETTPHIRAMTATVRLLTTALNIKTCNYPATGLSSTRINAILRCYNSTSSEETIGHPHAFVLGFTFPSNITYREIPYVLPTGNNNGFVAITESENNLGTDQTDTEVFLLAGGLYANVARSGADCNADGSCNFARDPNTNWCGERNKNWCVFAATGFQNPAGTYINNVWRFGNDTFSGGEGTSHSTMIIATTMAFLKRAYEHTDLSYKDIVSIVRSCASDLGDVGPDAENGLGALSYECLHQGFETPFAPHPKGAIRTEYAHSEFTASTPVSFPQYTSTTILTRSVQSSTSTDVERTEINRVSDAVLGETSAIETTTITYLISTRTDVTVTETTVSETIDFLGEEEIDRSSQVVGMTVTPLSHLSTGTQTQVLVSAVPYTVLEETTVEIDASTEIDVQRERTGRSTRVELGGLSATETVTILFLVSTRTDVLTTETSILETSTSLRTRLLAISTEVVSVDTSRASFLSTGTETQTLTSIIPYRVLQETSVQVEVGTATHTQRVETGRNTDTEFGTLSATQTTTISFLISTRTDVLTTRTSVLETSTHLRTQLLATGTEIVSVDTSRVTFLSTATETQVIVSVVPYTVLEETTVEVQVSTSVDVEREETGRSTRVELGADSATETVTVLFLVSTRTDVLTTETSILETSTSLRTRLLAISTEVVSVDVSRASFLSTGTETQILLTILPYTISTARSVEVEVSTSVETIETAISTQTGIVGDFRISTVTFSVSTIRDTVTTETTILTTFFHLGTELARQTREVVGISHVSSTITEQGMVVRVIRVPRNAIRIRVRVFLEGALQ